MCKVIPACLVLILILAIPNVALSQNNPNISFFITSAGSGNGANLGGLTGADAICQKLATSAGAGNKTWRAYLSTTAAGNQPAVNARDRIGKGPWQNAKGVVVAQNVDDLHSDKNKLGKENSLTEKGTQVNGRGDNPNTHDILTGSNADGTLAVGKTCSDWTSAAGPPDGAAPDGGSLFVARVGHADGFGPMCNTATTPNNLTSWNSAHDNAGCNDNRPRGGAGRLYCFAVN